MVLDNLGSSLRNTLNKIAKSVFVDDKLINELVKDIQRALLQADVNVKLVFNLSNTIKDRIKKEETPGGLTKREHLINIVYEELVKFLGGKKNEIKLEKKPAKIMLVGLFGSGKTTTAGKLAKYFSKRGKKVALVGLDVWRPAAMDQLEQISKQINVPCFIDKEMVAKGIKDPVKIWESNKENYDKYDIIIIDTAGRDALNDELIEEIESVTKSVKPDETLLVISADIGQAAEKQASQFHESCNVNGVIATKMDGTAKAGGALSACAITQAPIKFIGVGEKVDDLEEFNPKGFVGRLLGMGDLEALLEKAKEAISEDEAKDLSKKILKGDFNLLDLYEQMRAMKKMGPLTKVMEMIPGMGNIKMPKEALQVQEEKLKNWKFLMDSMTQEELEDPEEFMSPSRMERISKGSGKSLKEIRELMKQYKQSKKLVKMFKGGNPDQMMKKMQKGQLKGMKNMKF